MHNILSNILSSSSQQCCYGNTYIVVAIVAFSSHYAVVLSLLEILKNIIRFKCILILDR